MCGGEEAAERGGVWEGRRVGSTLGGGLPGQEGPPGEEGIYGLVALQLKHLEHGSGPVNTSLPVYRL